MADPGGASRTFTDAEQRLLDEHQGDTCEHEMSSCSGGCPRSYCTSEAHKGKVAPDWPCRVAAPILGHRNAAAYWQAEDEAWLAWHEADRPDARAESGESRG